MTSHLPEASSWHHGVGVGFTYESGGAQTFCPEQLPVILAPEALTWLLVGGGVSLIFPSGL